MLVGYSVYDYVHNLKGIPYPSEEYVQMRETVISYVISVFIDKQESSIEIIISKLE